jgi:hypothetical protein
MRKIVQLVLLVAATCCLVAGFGLAKGWGIVLLYLTAQTFVARLHEGDD